MASVVGMYVVLAYLTFDARGTVDAGAVGTSLRTGDRLEIPLRDKKGAVVFAKRCDRLCSCSATLSCGFFGGRGIRSRSWGQHPRRSEAHRRPTITANANATASAAL